MKKLLFVSIGLIIVLSVAFGCSSEKTEHFDVANAIEIAEKYKKTELEAKYIENTDELTLEQIREKEDEIRPLTNDTFFDKKSKDRIYSYSPYIANIKKADLHFKDLIFEERENDDTVKKLIYNGLLLMGDENIKISGRIELTNEEGAWKVSYDSYNLKDVIKIIDEDILQKL